MIQFLKPRGSGRRRPQRHIEVVEPIHSPLADVADWSETALTDEEAAEIQIAFQQQVAELSAVVPIAPTVVPELTLLVGGAADPLDLTQVGSFSTLEPDWPSVATDVAGSDVVASDDTAALLEPERDLAEFRSAIRDVQALPQSTPDLDLDQLDATFASGLAELLAEATPESFTVPFDPVEIEALAIETVELDSLEPELVLEPELLDELAIAPVVVPDQLAAAMILPETALEAVAPEVIELEVTAPEAIELEAVAPEVIELEVAAPEVIEPELLVRSIAVDLPETDARPEDVDAVMVNENWASDAVDVAVVDAAAETAEATQTAPLTYFQYYLDEPAIGGTSEAGETPTPYVTPWRQPSMPGGLIGAGVLGATLVSGFVIADTVKTQPVTAVKRPTPPAPLQSLSAKDQVMTTAALPKAMPPEAMKPEVALPPPKRGMTMTPMFPPMAPLGGNIAIAPLGDAIAANRTSSMNALPQSNLGVVSNPTPAAVPESPNAAPAPKVVSLPQPTVTTTPIPRNEAGVISPKVMVDAPTRPIPPAPVTERQPTESLPELLPDMATPLPANSNLGAPIAPRNDAPSSSRVPLADLTPEPVRSPLKPVETAPSVPPANIPPAAAPVEVIVPTAVPTAEVPTPAVPKAAVDQSAALPADRVFEREVAPSVLPLDQAATPMPPVTATAQPIANRLSNLPPQAQLLLAQPTDNSYGTVVASQWRPLTASEVRAIGRQAPQLAEFTRQSVSLEAYRQAYASVSQTADSLPSLGFIDFQRRLIILPPSSESAGAGAVASRTMSL
jgi:hypothetical protein